MGLVLWIDENTFASSLFEKAFKKEGKNFYTLASAQDFAYLVSDLDPEVIVIDAGTALKSKESLLAKLASTQDFNGRPIIIIDPRPGLEFIKHKIGEIQRPIDPFKLSVLIEKILKNH